MRELLFGADLNCGCDAEDATRASKTLSQYLYMLEVEPALCLVLAGLLLPG